MIAGCGRVGSDLAQRLADESHDVSVIDEREERFKLLGSTFNGTTYLGLAYDIRVLREAGIEFADAFVAVHHDDNVNVMSVQLAKQVFGVSQTIARLDEPGRAQAFRALGIDYVAGATLVSAIIHERITEPEFRHHVGFGSGEVSIVEIEISENTTGLTIEDIDVGDAVRVAAVRRGNHTYIPGADFELQPGDLIVASARHGARSKLTKRLARKTGH